MVKLNTFNVCVLQASSPVPPSTQLLLFYGLLDKFISPIDRTLHKEPAQRWSLTQFVSDLLLHVIRPVVFSFLLLLAEAMDELMNPLKKD